MRSQASESFRIADVWSWPHLIAEALPWTPTACPNFSALTIEGIPSEAPISNNFQQVCLDVISPRKLSVARRKPCCWGQLVGPWSTFKTKQGVQNIPIWRIERMGLLRVFFHKCWANSQRQKKDQTSMGALKRIEINTSKSKPKSSIKWLGTHSWSPKQWEQRYCPKPKQTLKTNEICFHSLEVWAGDSFNKVFKPLDGNARQWLQAFHRVSWQWCQEQTACLTCTKRENGMGFDKGDKFIDDAKQRAHDAIGESNPKLTSLEKGFLHAMKRRQAREKHARKGS